MRADERLEAQVAVVLGTQWGDEGKGKLVDILAQQYDIVARAQVTLAAMSTQARFCLSHHVGVTQEPVQTRMRSNFARPRNLPQPRRAAHPAGSGAEAWG